LIESVQVQQLLTDLLPCPLRIGLEATRRAERVPRDENGRVTRHLHEISEGRGHTYPSLRVDDVLEVTAEQQLLPLYAISYHFMPAYRCPSPRKSRQNRFIFEHACDVFHLPRWARQAPGMEAKRRRNTMAESE